MAYVKKSEEVDVDKLLQFVRERLPEYMVPSVVVYLGEFPLNLSGKVDRDALPKSENTRPEFSYIFVPPESKLQESMAEIWGEVVGFNHIGVEDNFFDLGGHSIHAVQMVSRIRERLDVNIAIRAVFDSPTIRGLCAEVMRLRT